MGKFKLQCGKATCGYALFGVLFGFCFPVIAIFFDVVIYLGNDLTMDNVKKIHEENPIHYIIDSAPFFLGIAFGVAGYFLDRARRYNKTLVQQRTVLETANTSLQKALDDFHAARELLVKSEKLASLGQLTAGIAHELKNPLNFITNFAESGAEIVDELQQSNEEEERMEITGLLKNNFKVINEHGRRANTILQSMMTFARTGDLQKRWVDINSLSSEAGEIASHGMHSLILGFSCEFRKELAPDLPKVNIMYEDISRVILNLLTNAFYAVNERSRKESENYRPAVTLTTMLDSDSVQGKKYIVVRVRDNGTGIPAENIEKIFNPFFTTKPSGEGTGLGLSLSHDIIDVHGGEMKVSSQLNSFTEFSFSLPLTDINEPELLKGTSNNLSR